MEEMTNQEGMGTKFIKDFCDHLRKGTSVLQKTSKGPNYIVNAETGHPYLGFNMIVANQGMFDAGLRSHLALSKNQMDNHKNERGFEDPFYARKGTKSIGTAFTKNPDAFYTDKSPEVVEGIAKAGDIKKRKDGTPYKDLNPYHLYAVPNLQKTELKFQLDEKGNKKVYTENQLSETEKYEKDKEVTNTRTGEKIAVKAGDPKILHFAGSVISNRVGNGKPLDYKEPEMVPIIQNQLVPYTRKNNSSKEVLMENLVKFFQGCMNGNFEGCKISSSEIDNIEKDFANHSRQFMGICNSALSRAYSDPNVLARMDEAVMKKEQQNTNTNTESNVNTKGKGRS